MLWDVFISHASEDKENVARPLAVALESAGLRVWYDEAQLKPGHSLREKIDVGLSQSRFGIVILSHAFFAKQWPKRELGGLFSRPDAIVPVWHELNASDIQSISPLLADIVAVSTQNGIEAVAAKILQVAGEHLQDFRPPAPYTSELSLSLERVRRALDVIEALANPATWPQLSHTLNGYPETGWIGTDSSTFVEILYGFFAPLVEYHKLAYAVERNLALLGPQARLQFALLESAFETFTNEGRLATTAPLIEYTPRVPGWRAKRLVNPTRYWWQGISAERFEAAVPYFLDAKNGAGGADLLVPAHEFLDVYRGACTVSDVKVQQAIGLIANAFYGFTPSCRPVLWRVCVALARIYNAILGNTAFNPESDDLVDLAKVYEPVTLSCFPFVCNVSAEETYEEYSLTLDATLQYLLESTLPRLRAYLAVPVERGADV